MKDYTVIALAFNGEARIYASTSKYLVERMRNIHQTHPTATAALGRFLTVSSMMSYMYKDGEKLQLKIAGDGPIGKMVVDAYEGRVRATIENPFVYFVYEDGPNRGKLNVGKAVGRGNLSVIRDFKGHHFTSSSSLVSGEIGDDFTYFYTVSEQTPSAVGLGVLVDRNLKVKVAGGFIVQLLPGASEKTIQELESNILNLTSVTDFYEKGNTPVDLIRLLSGGSFQLLETLPMRYYCGCRKARYKKTLLSLDLDFLETLLHDDKQAEIVCPYCKRVHLFNEDELKSIIDHKLARQKNKKAL